MMDMQSSFLLFLCLELCGFRALQQALGEAAAYRGEPSPTEGPAPSLVEVTWSGAPPGCP
jgi:hypothetical protein